MRAQLNDDINNSFEDIPEDEIVENSFSAEEIQRKIEIRAHREAEKRIRKNRRELKRLKEHAGECVLNGNFEGYSYAIKKLKKFYKQPYNDDLIKTMWNTTRKSIDDFVASHK